MITTGAKRSRAVIPEAFTVVGWRLVAEQAATAEVDILLNGVSITAAARPSLSAAASGAGDTLTGWTTSLPEGGVLSLSVLANDAAKYLSLQIEVTPQV